MIETKYKSKMFHSSLIRKNYITSSHIWLEHATHNVTVKFQFRSTFYHDFYDRNKDLIFNMHAFFNRFGICDLIYGTWHNVHFNVKDIFCVWIWLSCNDVDNMFKSPSIKPNDKQFCFPSHKNVNLFILWIIT